MDDTASTWKGRLITLGVLAVIVAAGWWFFFYEDVAVLPPGVHAPDEPVQTAFGPATLRADDEHTVTALAEFNIQAKVLSRKRYGSGKESDYSPIDLALGWGQMSDQRIVDRFKIGQRGRWYTWRYSGPAPIPHSEIERSSANMHLIPADDQVRQAMLAVRKGEIVSIEGYLVKVEANGGWRWNSSMSRNDTGNGACEIVWVEDFTVVMSD